MLKLWVLAPQLPDPVQSILAAQPMPHQPAPDHGRCSAMAAPAVDVGRTLLAYGCIDGVEDVIHHARRGDAGVLNGEPQEPDVDALLARQLKKRPLVRNERLAASTFLVGFLKTHDGPDA